MFLVHLHYQISPSFPFGLPSSINIFLLHWPLWNWRAKPFWIIWCDAVGNQRPASKGLGRQSWLTGRSVWFSRYVHKIATRQTISRSNTKRTIWYHSVRFYNSYTLHIMFLLMTFNGRFPGIVNRWAGIANLNFTVRLRLAGQLVLVFLLVQPWFNKLGTSVN